MYTYSCHYFKTSHGSGTRIYVLPTPNILSVLELAAKVKTIFVIKKDLQDFV